MTWVLMALAFLFGFILGMIAEANIMRVFISIVVGLLLGQVIFWGIIYPLIWWSS